MASVRPIAAHAVVVLLLLRSQPPGGSAHAAGHGQDSPFQLEVVTFSPPLSVLWVGLVRELPPAMLEPSPFARVSPRWKNTPRRGISANASSPRRFHRYRSNSFPLTTWRNLSAFTDRPRGIGRWSASSLRQRLCLLMSTK